jgi:hypothetical protein
MSSYKNMPGDSRVWIYQCDRFLSGEEENVLRNGADAFVQQWNSHGADLDAAYELFFSKFLVFFVDESKAGVSGCSIDKSVALVKGLETELNVDFFNRTLIAYFDKDQLTQKPMHDFWALRKANIVTNETIVFNNLVKTKEEFEASWKVPFAESWHAEMW